MRCVFCGRPVNTQTDYRRVSGWERARSEGGTNQITLREPSPDWACASCITRRRHGISDAQMELLP